MQSEYYSLFLLFESVSFAAGSTASMCVSAICKYGQSDVFGSTTAHAKKAHFFFSFTDSARGGMRLVTPRNPEQFSLESKRHYDECYGLAFAQQLKNKVRLRLSRSDPSPAFPLTDSCCTGYS